MADILKELQGIFRDVFDDEDLEIQEDTNANDIEDWDSLSQMNLLVAIEKKFGIHFSVIEIVDLKNVGDMVELVEQKLQITRKSNV